MKNIIRLGLLLSLLLSHRLVYAQDPQVIRLGQAMTTAGDMIINNTRAQAARLPIGTAGQVLVVGASGIPEWGTSGSILLNPIISGNLTFSTAAAKIIPGATSLTFRNNADNATNLGIADNGNLTLRGDVSFTAGSNILSAGTMIFGTSNTSSILLRANSLTRWTIDSTAGALTQDPTNGGDILVQKSGTGIIIANTTSVGIQTGQQLRLYNGGSGAIKPNNLQLEIETASNGGANISNATANTSGYYFSNPTASYDGAMEYGNTSRALVFRAAGSTKFTISSTGTFIGSGTADIGWTRVNGANVACNTTCTAPCVFGWDTAAPGVLLACTDATADSCLCAGAS